MRIYFANARYSVESSTGGNAHIRQFIENCTALGHEVWMGAGTSHPDVQLLPMGRLAKVRRIRTMDAIYIRVENNVPKIIRSLRSPYRHLIGNPLMVWELNTIPGYGNSFQNDGLLDDRAPEKNFIKYSTDCDLAVCVSAALTEYAKSKLGVKRGLTVPNGSDPELYRPGLPPVPRLQITPDQLNVVWIGSADLPWHNFDLLAGAANLLWNRGFGTRIAFHIIGQGFRLMHRMPPNVNYYGAQRYEDVPNWLSAMDIGLCLYRPGLSHYNSPLKLFDYMSSGLAVVATPHPQVEQIFHKIDQDDFVVPYNDPTSLANRLVLLANNRGLVETQGLRGRQVVLDFYNWHRAAKDILQEIEQLLEERVHNE